VPPEAMLVLLSLPPSSWVLTSQQSGSNQATVCEVRARKAITGKSSSINKKIKKQLELW
jgi:hypothetical protein